jgi:hypothetical protein
MTHFGSFEEAAMNDKTGGNRGPRHAAALAVAAAVAVLATGCGVQVHIGDGSADSASTGSPTYAQELALAACMRSHGVPNFPDPNTSGGYSLTPSGSLNGADGSVDINSAQAQAAYGDCKHLLPGGPSISQLEQIEQQEQQRQAQMLPLLLKYSQCMRGHGVPNFPSPGQSKASTSGVPINPNSPQYLAAAGACQHLLPPGAKVSVNQSRSAS